MSYVKKSFARSIGVLPHKLQRKKRHVTEPLAALFPGDLAPSTQSMIFLANKNPYQHALQA